jgi:hypothetical protein
MRIAAIETMYNGILFRSRLEATWAAFFDLCGWEWIYEPFDLCGWVPDFEIMVKGNTRLLCEVKPENLQTCRLGGIDQSPYKKAMNHIQDFDLLFLGISPFEAEDVGVIGLLYQRRFILEGEIYTRTAGGGDYVPKEWIEGTYFYCDYAAFKIDNGKYGFSPVIGIWDDWIANTYRKKFDYKKECFAIFSYAKNIARKQYN